ncbi:MAG: site-specific DNA-methyltransferase, partial [Gammaproteobacteria bacterium]
LARHLVWTATGAAPATIRKNGKDGLFHESATRLYYLIYQPDQNFLLSNQSALNGDHADRIAKQVQTKRKPAMVFATSKFIGQKELTKMKITFCGLPYAVEGLV